MKLLTVTSAALALALLAPYRASAQPPAPPSPAPISLRVKQADPFPRIGNLTQFVATLVKLRLIEAGFIRVTQVAEEPPCGIDRSKRESEDQAKSPAEPAASYLIAIDLHKLPNTAAAEFVVDYELTRIEKCDRTEIVHRSETFPEADTLENLKMMSDVVAVLARSDAVHLPIIELLVTTAGSATAARDEMSNEIASRILRSLNAPGELDAKLASKASGRADYVVAARLDFTTPAITAQFTIQPRSGEKIALTVAGSQKPAELDSFYTRASKSVVGVIDDLRFTRATGLMQRLTELRTGELRRVATGMLCVPAPEAGCVAQPKEAEPVLLRLADETQTEEAYEWLGVAQVGAGKYAAAGDTLIKAASKTADSAIKFRVTLLAADAQYKAKRFDAAAAQYEAARAISRLPGAPPFSTAPQGYLQWVRALRLGTAGPGRAVDTLLSGLADAGVEPEPLILEFRDLIDDARGDIVNSISRKVQSASAEVKALLLEPMRRALVREQLATAERAYARRDFKGMDASLHQVEDQATDVAIDAPTRETMARLRGLWLRDQEPQATVDVYTQAEARFKEALGWEPRSHRAQFALATTYASWPSDPTMPSTTGRLNQASDMFADLAAAHFPGAAGYLREVNTVLKRHDQTRKVLERVVAVDATDRGALLTLMGVCTDDLLAFDCAAAAADKLDVLDRSNPDPGTQLDLTEIEVLAGRHAAAADRLTRVMASNRLTDSNRAVGLFYQAWLAYLKAPTTTPGSLLESWKSVVNGMRASRSDILWTFRGARGTLLQASQISKPAESEAVNQLLAMLDEMEKRP